MVLIRSGRCYNDVGSNVRYVNECLNGSLFYQRQRNIDHLAAYQATAHSYVITHAPSHHIKSHPIHPVQSLSPFDVSFFSLTLSV